MQLLVSNRTPTKTERQNMRAFSLLVCFIVSGCSTIDYKRTSIDGTNVSITGWSIGTDSALSGLSYSVDNAHFSIEDASSDQTKLIESIVTGAVKGMK
jgi:hypothetical protein